MRKHIIRSLFVVVGAALGFYYLPMFWNMTGVTLPGIGLLFSDILIGAIIFWLLSLRLGGYIERLVNRTENYLTKQSQV
ncbi:MAG: hypothetical protein ACTIM9_05600 [Paucilactobacillus nenjiangensis]